MKKTQVCSWKAYFLKTKTKVEVWEISRLFPETLMKLYFHVFHLWLSVLTRGSRVTKRCRLSWLTNSASYMSPNAWGGVRVLANVYVQQHSYARHCTAHEAQINFGDLTPYLTYGRKGGGRGGGEGTQKDQQKILSLLCCMIWGTTYLMTFRTTRYEYILCPYTSSVKYHGFLPKSLLSHGNRDF